MASRAVKKVYDNKLCALLEKYSKILIVGADNVDTKQLQDIRRALHDKAVVSMGKNPMMRRSLRIYAERTGNKAFLGLIPFIKGNVGLIFTNGDLQEVGAEIGKHKVGEPARVSLVSSIGLVPPIDIVSQPGSTGMDPSHTSIFEDPTKIAVAMAPVAAADPGAAPDVAAKGRMSLGG